MVKWFKLIIPCLRNKHEDTILPDKNLTLLENLSNTPKDNQINELDILHNKDSEIEIFNEVFDEPLKCGEADSNLDKQGNKNKEIFNNPQHPLDLHSRTFISCTLHESLDNFCQAKITHTTQKSRSTRTEPHNTLVFKTVMVDGEPCTRRFKMAEPNLIKDHCLDESDLKLGEQIKDSDIKLVFSHDVLDYLTKSFLHNKDNDLNRQQSGANDLVVCTLFPKQTLTADETDMEIDVPTCESHANDNVSDINDNMDVDVNSNSVAVMQTDNYVINKNQSSPAQRSEHKLFSTNSVKGFHTSMSKSSPQMQQQDNSNSINNRELTRLRRNIPKRVSWKENVEVCFFNYSSKSANEILQEVQPLIDHEVYWKECVCEIDRKRREKWLKIRADEQRCLTGDGQFHDYFAYRMHHFDDDDIRLIE